MGNKNLDINTINAAANMNLFDFVKSGAQYKDQDTVFSFFGKNFSYGFFKEKVDKISRILLADKELKKGDRVVISLLSSPEAVCLVYACNYIGLVPVMADIRLSPGEMRRVIEETDAKYAFMTDIISARLSVICKAECLRKLFVVPIIQSLGYPALFFRKFSSFFTGNPYMFTSLVLPKAFMWKHFENTPGIPDDEKIVPAGSDGEIIFTTSGTTGEKKYVRHTAKNLNLNVLLNEYYFDLRSPECGSILAYLPLFVCFGFAGSIHTPLYYSMKIHVHMIYDLRKIPDIFMKVRPNVFFSSLGHWERIIRSKKFLEGDLSFLKFALCSGEKCDPEKIKNINNLLEKRGCTTKILQAYGMTELTVISVQQPEDDLYGNVGKPFPPIKIKITDPETGKEMNPGEEGEICINSPCRTLGYLNNKEETDKFLRVHEDNKVWAHSGDIGYIDRRGYLYVKDRIKNMLVSVSGTKIYLPTIDEAVSKLPCVERAIAVSINDGDTKVIKAIILFVEPAAGNSASGVKKEVKSFVLSDLPRYLVPDKIEIIDELPLLPSGKIDRRALEKRAEDLGAKKESVVSLK